MKDSPYYQYFADDASLFETKLASLDEYLHLLNQDLTPLPNPSPTAGPDLILTLHPDLTLTLKKNLTSESDPSHNPDPSPKPQIQRKWVYLEPIFGRGALPQAQGGVWGIHGGGYGAWGPPSG